MTKTAVVALGGNALTRLGQSGTAEELAVDRVMLDYGTPQATELDTITAAARAGAPASSAAWSPTRR